MVRAVVMVTVVMVTVVMITVVMVTGVMVTGVMATVHNSLQDKMHGFLSVRSLEGMCHF